MSSINIALALACFVTMAFGAKTIVTKEEAMNNLAILEHHVNMTNMSPYTKYIVTMGLMRMKMNPLVKNTGSKRVKRAGNNSHWCCKEDPVTGTEYATRQVKELVQVTKIRKVKTGCGWWRTCTKEITYTALEVRYKTVVDTREVPAPEWVNGCPDDKIVCCRGFIWNKHVNNCMTNAELEELLKILAENAEAMRLLELFG